MSRRAILIIAVLAVGGLAVIAAVTSTKSPERAAAPDAPDADPGGGGGGRVHVDGSPPRLPREKGTVAGRVVDKDGKPMAGAQVVLVTKGEDGRPGSNFRISMGGGEMSASVGFDRPARPGEIVTTTSSEGEFTFSTAKAGPFVVSASADGYAPAFTGAVKAGTTDVTITLHPGGSVSGLVTDETGAPVGGAVVHGAGVLEITDEMGEFTLPDLATGPDERVSAEASGYQTAVTNVAVVAGETTQLETPLVLTSLPGVIGRVFDPSGEPLESVAVTSGSVFQGMSVAETDAGGRYHLADLPSSELSLGFKHADYLKAELTGFRYEKGSRLVLPDVRLAPGGVIAGRVTGPDGEPIEGAQATTFRADRGFDMQAMLTMGPEARDIPTSDAEGNYRVAGLETGTYTLMVRAEGFRPFVMKEIAVRVPDVTPVDATLERGNSIAGRVVDGEGNPVPGATITPREDRMPTSIEEAMLMNSGGATATSGEDGSFVVSGLGDRKVRLNVLAEGFSREIVDDVEPGTTDLLIRLGKDGSVSGAVLDDESGLPLAGVSVVVGSSVAVTVEDGTFTVEGVGPGTWKLTANGDDHAPAVVDDVAVRAGEETSGIEVRLKRGLTITGMVLRARDLSPVADANVTLTGQVHRTVKTDAQGRFELRGLTPGSDYELRASADGFAEGRLPSMGVPPQGEIRITLGMGGTIRGVVRAEDGGPVSGKIVMLGGEGGNFGSGVATPDAEGRFTMEHVRPGTVSLILMSIGGGSGFGIDAQTKQVTVREGEEVFVEFGGSATAKKATLTGRLLDRGKPLAGKMLMLLPLGRGGGAGLLSGFKMATTDAEGVFSISDLAPGRYAVISGDMGSQDMGVARELVIKEGGEIEQDIELPAGTLGGTVVGDDEKPLEGARVALIAAEAATRPVRSLGEMLTLFKGQAKAMEDGAFEIKNAVPGRYLVQAAADGYAPALVDDVTVSEERGRPLRIRMSRGSELAVAVTDPEDGPVVGAAVFVLDGAGRWVLAGEDMHHRTGSDGRVRIRLVPGPYRIIVQPRGLALTESEILVAGDTELAIGVAAGGTARIVATSGGAPVEDAEVRIFAEDGREIAWRVTEESMMTGGIGTTTGADGSVTFADLPAGNLRFTVTTPDGRKGETSVRISEGAQTEAAVELK